MSARLARSVFSVTARRVPSAASTGRALSRRNIATSAHGEQAKPNDMPWMVASGFFFGPLFLYFISPTGRRNFKSVHNDKQHFPAAKVDDAPSLVESVVVTKTRADEAAKSKASWGDVGMPEVALPILMQDDEGKVENVAGTLALSEESDAPKDAVSPEEFKLTKEEASVDVVPPSSADKSVSDISQATRPAEGQPTGSGTFQQPGEEGPTNLGVAREAAQAHVAPKQHAESH